MPTETPDTPDQLDDDDFAWLLQEFTLTAERARDRGITPAEFLMGLQAYGKRLMDDYATPTE